MKSSIIMFLNEKIKWDTLSDVLISLGNTYWYRLWCITRLWYNWEWKEICSRRLKKSLYEQEYICIEVIAYHLWFDLYNW